MSSAQRKPRKQGEEKASMKGTPAAAPYRLHLFVAGREPNSAHALIQVERLMKAHPELSFDLKITDVFAAPEEAARYHAFLTPMLLVSGPASCRIYGSLSDWSVLHASIGLHEPQE